MRSISSAGGRTEDSQFVYESHPETMVGDLVTYTEDTGRTAGIVRKIIEQEGATKRKLKKSPILAEIENYYTKKVVNKDLSSIQSVARKAINRKGTTPSLARKPPASATSTFSTTKPTVAPPSSATTKPTVVPPSFSATTKPTVAPPSLSAKTKPTAAPSLSTAKPTVVPPSVATSKLAPKSKIPLKGTPTPVITTSQTTTSPQVTTRLEEQAQKLDEQVNMETSPLNIDFTPGDVVRYRVGQNFTAGVVLDVMYGPKRGDFSGATKESPMAKLENLWTKKTSYHHLNLLEHIKRSKDVTPGRFAETEYEVYRKWTSNMNKYLAVHYK